MDSYARFGYSLTPNIMDVLKRRDFAQWQARKGIPDAFLCKAVSELNGGLVHANLGGSDARLRALESGVLLEVHCEQNHRGIT